MELHPLYLEILSFLAVLVRNFVLPYGIVRKEKGELYPDRGQGTAVEFSSFLRVLNIHQFSKDQ